MADTLMPIYLSRELCGYNLHYVIKRELLFDPCIDLAGSWLPHYMVRRGSGAGTQEVKAIGSMMEGLKPKEGVVIFAEGTRFSQKKQARVRSHLRELGEEDVLAWAERYRRVLPPRTGGPLELLRRNTNADVLFCAHVGLDKSASFRETFNGGLVGTVVRVRIWGYPYAEVPKEPYEQRRWLFEQWKEVDDFVCEHGGG